MRLHLFLIFMHISGLVFCQGPTTIYAFPGQGSDQRLFDSLKIKDSYKIRVINYGTPEKHMNMTEFARSLATQIDTTQPFILLGVSMGGMICTELSEVLHPRQTILISSAKNKNELPFRYKFQSHIPLYKIFPGSVLFAGAKFLQPIVEPDRNKQKETFKQMLGAKNSLYMKRTVSLIIHWNRDLNHSEIIHIHGSKDHTIPVRNIKNPNYIIKDGSHMMTLTRADEISALLNKILE